MNINDIARIAGVSKATVSRVINNKKVTEELRVRVQKVLDETGYKPNRLAQELVSKKTNLIGIVVPTMNSNVYSNIIEGATRILQSQNYNIILVSTFNNKVVNSDLEIEYLDLFKRKYVDGIIFFPTIATDAHIAYFKDFEIPTITIGERVRELNLTSFSIDDYKIAKDMVNYLIKLGHKRIGYIGVKEEYRCHGKARKCGYVDALTENGIEVDESLMETGGFDSHSGYLAAKRLVEKATSMPTAIFTVIDRLAYGAISYLDQIGYKVPQQVSIASIDDEEMSIYYIPSLTTAHVDYLAAGKAAASVLMDLVEGKTVEKKEFTIEYVIKERNSTI